MKIRNGFVSNSSSSSFICSTDMRICEVRRMLEKLLDMHNEFMNEDLSFDDVFRQPFIADEAYTKGEWAGHYRYIADSKGKVIIESAGDNSIPYEMFDYIEEKFDAVRCHLG
jgi:hypothetical protein